MQIDLQHHAQRLLLFLAFDVCWLQQHRCLEWQGHCPRLEEKKELELGRNLFKILFPCQSASTSIGFYKTKKEKTIDFFPLILDL